MIGIYKITNKITNKCYIGQSVDIELRWSKHISTYSSNNCPDYQIYRAMKKYGLSNFSFEILEECQKEKLNEREIYWINKFNSYEDGYNMTLGGEACNGTNDKAVYQYDKNGYFLQAYKSAHEASRINNIQFTNICKVCRGERTTAGGYRWSYFQSAKLQDIKIYQPKNSIVLQLSKDDVIIKEYLSAAQAERETGISQTTIGLVCKGKGKTAGGFKWRYKNNE